MNNGLKILFIEDLETDVELEILELRKENIQFEYTVVWTSRDLSKALEEFRPEIIISDYNMPSLNGLEALEICKRFNPEIPFILCTGSVNEEIAVECIKAGAEDYIIKEHMTRLPFSVKEALEKVNNNREKRAFELLVRESEQKLQSIFASAPVGIGLVVNRVLMEVNDTLCKIVGYTKSEMIGKSSRMLYPDVEEFEYVGREKYKQINENGTGSVVTRFKCKNGSIINVLLSSTPLDRNDYSKGVTFTVLDITSEKKAENELRKSEEKFRSIAENMSDIIFITDREGFINYISPSCSLFGYSQDEFAGRFFGDFLGEEEIESAMKRFSNALNSIQVDKTVTLIFKRKNGTEFYAELSGSQFKIEDEVFGVLGLIRDVTDKMSRDLELRKLSQAVEQSPVSIVITNTEGIIEYVNPKFCEVTGYSASELEGKNPGILGTKEKTNEEYKLLWNIIKSGQEWKGEFHNRKKNGELYWESASISPIKNEKDQITHFLGIKEDITLSKILEEKTFESEKRYHELFLYNPVPTYIFDETTLKFIEVNDATVQYYGYSREDFVKMTLKDIRPPEDLEEFYKSLQKLDSDVFHSDKMRHRKKNGTIFPVEITSHSLPAKSGRKSRLVMAKDITESVEAARQMELAREKAVASDRLKTTFLNNISHEVRTPLNGILGFAEIISDPFLTEEIKEEAFAILHESSNRLLVTITNYMDISLITSGNISVHPKVFSTGQMITRMFGIYQPLGVARNLVMQLDLPQDSDNHQFCSDHEIINKVLVHLLSNAVKFTDSGTITLGYTQDERELVIFVQDTGIGIENTSLESVFERFVKEERIPSRLTEGSGLGLSIAKGLVEALGGRIEVESEPGNGSCFRVFIPSTQIATSSPSEIIAGVAVKAEKELCIMVAEDDYANFYLLRTLLEKEIKARIIHAVNGAEAIDLFKSNPGIDLILMDIKMPVKDGFHATREIKALRKNIPVIAITAYAMSGDEERVLAAGCDHYLSKPINKTSLRNALGLFIQ